MGGGAAPFQFRIPDFGLGISAGGAGIGPGEAGAQHRMEGQLALSRSGQRRTPLTFRITRNQAVYENTRCPAIGSAIGCFRFMNWRDKILSDPQVLRGKPCIKGTRIPAALVLGYLAAGRETDAILKEFPDLTAADVVACLDYARDLAEFEAVGA